MSGRLTAEEIAAALGGRETKHGWMALCPAHEDRNPSLQISEGEGGRVLVHCHAGCTQQAVIAALRARGLWPEAAPAGLTLQEYAAAKGLGLDFLRAEGLRDQKYFKADAVRIPYLAADGRELAVRYRLALAKGAGADNRFRWQRGSKLHPYGLNHLEHAREAGYVILVEGESDCHTLWQAGFPALGVPGANTWQPRWADYLDGIERIYVVVEPDQGGEAVLSWLSASPLRERAFLLDLGGHKDPSAFYLADTTTFAERLKAAIAAARPWKAVQAKRRSGEADEAYRLAKDLLHDPALMARVGEAIAACGYAGDLRTAKIVYLALTSRLMERPLNLHIKAPSAAGKSFNFRVAARLVPEEAVFDLGVGSERALIYSDEDYRHRVVFVAERDSLPEEGPAASAIRELADENQMSYHVVERNEETGQFYTRHIVKPGPTGLITTGLVSLGEQMGTRVLEIEVLDSAEQTRAILELQASQARSGASSEVDLEPFLALQRWLELAGVRDVSIPFAEALFEAFPEEAFRQVRLRRDFTKLLGCVKTLAMLHQKQRSIVDGCVQADIADYAVARDLLEPVFESIVAEGVTAAVRETVQAVADMAAEDGAGPVTLKSLAQKLDLSTTATYHRIRNALRGGWLVDGRGEDERKRRAPMQLAVGAALPDEKTTLPSPEDVSKRFYVSSVFREKYIHHPVSENGQGGDSVGGMSLPGKDGNIETPPVSAVAEDSSVVSTLPGSNGVHFTPAEVDQLAGPPDRRGRRPALDVAGHFFDEHGRLWEGDEEALQGTIRYLRGRLAPGHTARVGGESPLPADGLDTFLADEAEARARVRSWAGK